MEHSPNDPYSQQQAPANTPYPNPQLPAEQRNQANAENLKLLSIFHYVLGGLNVLFGFFPLIYVVMGIFVLNNDFSDNSGSIDTPDGSTQELSKESARAVFGIMVGIGSVGFVLLETLAICTIFAGRFISQRRRHIFCLIVAGAQCIFFPFGTALGVFSLILLNKQDVKEEFQ